MIDCLWASREVQNRLIQLDMFMFPFVGNRLNLRYFYKRHGSDRWSAWLWTRGWGRSGWWSECYCIVRLCLNLLLGWRTSYLLLFGIVFVGNVRMLVGIVYGSSPLLVLIWNDDCNLFRYTWYVGSISIHSLVWCCCCCCCCYCCSCCCSCCCCC